MSDLWRISVTEDAAPVTLTPSPVSTGAMVIRSPKGIATPQKIRKGQTNEIFRRFGYPSSTYPDIQEAIDYNNDSDLWVSAPSDSTEGLHGGVLITTSGTIPLTIGIEDPSLFSFTTIPYKLNIGTGNDVLTNFTDILDNYVNSSLDKILVGSTEIDVTVTDAEPEVISGTGISSGTVTRSTKAIDITFSSAPATGDEIYAIYQVDLSSTTYFALFSKSFNSLNDESVLTTYNVNTGEFKWNFYIKDFRGTSKLISDYKGSITPGSFDVLNILNFIETKYEDNNYFIPKVNTALAYTSFTADTTLVNFAGGTRASSFSISDYTIGWDFFKDKGTYPAKIFMDVTTDSGIPAIFDNLRKNFQAYSRYLIPLPLSATKDTAISVKQGYSIDNRGLYFFWNQGLRQESYTKTKFYSSLIGLVGIKYAEIMRSAYGGLAPSWLNENGLGGQLSVLVESMRSSDWSETDLQAMDEAGLNPIVKYAEYGVLITSQKTGQNPNVVTDFSYSAHSGLADYHIENVVNDVLVPQQTKLNDPYHRARVKSGADAIIGVTQFVGNNTLLTNFLNKCDSENNDADVLNRREFVLETVVQFTPTSEKILYTYKSAPQGVSVEEALL